MQILPSGQNGRGNNGRGNRLLGRWFLGLAALSLFGLSACSSDDGLSLTCPRVVVVKDAQNQVRFIGEGRDLTDVAFEARIEGQGIDCDYDDDEIEVTMEVRIEVTRGPAAEREGADLDYFVAVAHSDRTILARDAFGISVDMPGNHTRVVALDEVYPTIPIAPGETGSDFRIYVGLSLTPEELAYNRNNR